MPRPVFGATWWGKAWIEALEGRAQLDPNRLPRGRSYARQDRAGALLIDVGTIGANVQGSRLLPYQVVIRVRPFTPQEWDVVLDTVAGRAAHSAALLDGELKPEILDEVRVAGVDLLPGADDLEPTCTCPDAADLCKHTAAVCYLMAGVLDRDPFELFHVRGRARADLLAEVRERRRPVPSEPTVTATTRSRKAPVPSAPTIPARTAFAAPPVTADDLWALGAAPPAHPGHPVPLSVPPPLGSGIDARDLHDLAADAAQRAWDLLRGDDDGGLGLPPDHDLARRAAAVLNTDAFDRLARRVGLPRRHLERHALAWGHGGDEGLEVLSETWIPEPGLLDEGRAALEAFAAGSGVRYGPDAATRPIKQRGNTLIRGNLQLRLSRSGAWYRLVKIEGHWEIDDGPVADPAVLFAAR